VSKAAPSPLSAELLAVPKGAAAPAPEAQTEQPRRPAVDVAPPVEEPRTALTVRLPVSTQERLREAAHRTRREKQAIVDEALLAWLDGKGF
jgi:hypothetical protein